MSLFLSLHNKYVGIILSDVDDSTTEVTDITKTELPKLLT